MSDNGNSNTIEAPASSRSYVQRFFANIRQLELPIQIVNQSFKAHPIAKFCAFYFLDILVHPAILNAGNIGLSTMGFSMVSLLPMSMVSLTIVAMGAVLIAYPIAETINYLNERWIKNTIAFNVLSNIIRFTTHLITTAYLAQLHGEQITALFSLYTAGTIIGVCSFIFAGLMAKLFFDLCAMQYELMTRPVVNAANVSSSSHASSLRDTEDHMEIGEPGTRSKKIQ